MRAPPLVDAEGNPVDAATYANSFIDDQIAKATDVGDLSSVTRNLKGTTELMNTEPVDASHQDRRRRMTLGDHVRRLEEVDAAAETRSKMMGTLGGASESMQLTANVVTQQGDTVSGVSSDPEQMSEDSLSGGNGASPGTQTQHATLVVLYELLS